MTEDQIESALVHRADKLDRLERALRDIAAVIVPPAEAECDYEHQRVIYRLRSIALKALGEEEE